MYLKNFKQWLKCATVRAVKTIAQTAVSTIGVTAMMNEVIRVAAASASLLPGILSMLTPISGLPEVKEDNTNAKGN